VTRLRAALTALALAVTVLLTGCSQAAPSTTAVVNGVMITEGTVEDMTTQYIAVAGGDWSQTRALVARQYVLGTAARQIAADKAIPLSTAKSDTKLTTYPQLAELIALGDDLGDVTKALSTDEFAASMNTVAVTLNPRYGTWKSYSDITITALPTGSLSDIAQR
jgi:hypothetical protein